MRFYDGAKVSTKRKDQADRLVRSYITNINRARRASENYGGSTGGKQNTDQFRYSAGLGVLKQRQSKLKEVGSVFKQEGIGRFGARKESFIAKQFDPEARDKLIARQKGIEQDETTQESTS
tara:strand:+ start:981 stop:1343 length:363 start_codon:yes stop_codon:yes gene_type:complete